MPFVAESEMSLESAFNRVVDYAKRRSATIEHYDSGILRGDDLRTPWSRRPTSAG